MKPAPPSEQNLKLTKANESDKRLSHTAGNLASMPTVQTTADQFDASTPVNITPVET